MQWVGETGNTGSENPSELKHIGHCIDGFSSNIQVKGYFKQTWRIITSTRRPMRAFDQIAKHVLPMQNYCNSRKHVSMFVGDVGGERWWIDEFAQGPTDWTNG